MKAGKWSLIRREEGGCSLYEEIPVPSEGSESAVETVERGHFDLRCFWLVLALAGKVIWLVRDMLRRLYGRRTRCGKRR